MKADIWYGTSTEFKTNGHEYVMLVMTVPPLEQNMRNALAYLQNVEELYVGIKTSDFKIFDVHSSCDGEDATISVIVPIVSANLAPVIRVLNMIEKRLEEEDFADMKKRASNK